jgi:putative hemolysin
MFNLPELNTLQARHARTRETESPLCPVTGPAFEKRAGRYTLRLARTPAELDAVLKLRFEVFNLELGEGLAASFATGRDGDAFDAVCHHLIVLETETGRIVGTYRMQTSELAARGQGFYAAQEFDLTQLPATVLHNAVELGRACIAQAHRQPGVLYLLWQGLAAYLRQSRKRYLFGCCSLTSQNAAEGWQALQLLRAQGHCHPQFFAPAQPGYECLPPGPEHESAALPRLPRLPRLFRTYLRYGARVCSPPALDRQFKTIDFLVMFDKAEMDQHTAQLFF